MANMIGAGILTTLGFQMAYVQNTLSLLIMWVVGGFIALAGAFVYAELGSHISKSGGEYRFLSELIHPIAGYLAGWVSITVGFAAPVALSAVALGSYLSGITPGSELQIAIICIITISIIHSFHLRQSAIFQNSITAAKVFILLIIGILCFSLPSTENAFIHNDDWYKELFSGSFLVALIFVMYSYSGFNAAAYITDEIKDPKRSLPKALITGTLAVIVLFIFTQLGYMYQAGAAGLSGKIEVGRIVAESMLGSKGEIWFSIIISMLLISSMSAMIWVGPRVIRAIAGDYKRWQYFKKDNNYGLPVRAVWLQAALSILLILTGSFEQIIIFSGIILQLSLTLTVSSVFILRGKKRNLSGYRSPLYPILPLFFIIFSIVIMTVLIIQKPWESLVGLAILCFGFLLYLVDKRIVEPDR
jgi:APA family basic amino acid/polyamine antiporter